MKYIQYAQLVFRTKVVEIHKNYVNRSSFNSSVVSNLNQTSPCTPKVEMDGQIGCVCAPASVDDVINKNIRCKKRIVMQKARAFFWTF